MGSQQNFLWTYLKNPFKARRINLRQVKMLAFKEATAVTLERKAAPGGQWRYTPSGGRIDAETLQKAHDEGTALRRVIEKRAAKLLVPSSTSDIPSRVR